MSVKELWLNTSQQINLYHNIINSILATKNHKIIRLTESNKVKVKYLGSGYSDGGFSYVIENCISNIADLRSKYISSVSVPPIIENEKNYRKLREKFIQNKISRISDEITHRYGRYSAIRTANSAPLDYVGYKKPILHCTYRNCYFYIKNSQGKQSYEINFKKLKDEYSEYRWSTDTDGGRFLLDVFETVEVYPECSLYIAKCKYYDIKRNDFVDGHLAVNPNSSTLFMSPKPQFARGFLKSEIKRKFASVTER